MSVIQSKLMAIILMMMSFTNMVLISIVFYLLMPLISPNNNIEKAPRVVENIMSSLNPDVVVFWQVNLETNSRRAITFRVKDEKDSNNVITYINVGQLMTFSNAINPPVVQRLLGGDSICYKINDAGIISLTVISIIMKNYPNAMGCVSPNKNKSGILNGYVLTLWKIPLDENSQQQVISHIQNILEQR